MTRFDLLKQLDIDLAAKLIFIVGRKYDNAEQVREHLAVEFTEDELQQMEAAARYDDHPMSLSLRQ